MEKRFVSILFLFLMTANSFAADKISNDTDNASSSIAWYNGLYWYSSGLGHYFVVTYKF